MPFILKLKLLEENINDRMQEISKNFELFLSKCDNIKNHKGQILRSTYYKGFLPWFKEYRDDNNSHKENLEGMTQNGLTEEEAFVILAYTGSYSSWLNSNMRNGELSSCDCKNEFINRLNNSLDKIKCFNDEVVYRMDSPYDKDDNIIDWFKAKTNSIFRIPYFLSTAKEDYKNSEVVWEIETLTFNSLGKDISNLTNNQYELEVLFRTGSCFQIKSIDSKKRYVKLKEVRIDSKIDFELTGLYNYNI